MQPLLVWKNVCDDIKIDSSDCVMVNNYVW